MSFSPPSLFGTIIQFQSRAQLDWFERQEMSQSRLTVIGDGATQLFVEIMVTVRLADQNLGSMKVMAVHSDFDLLGLQVLESMSSDVSGSSASPATQTMVSPKGSRETQISKNEETSVKGNSNSVSQTHTHFDRKTSNSAAKFQTKVVPKASKPTDRVGAAGRRDNAEEEYGGLLLDRYGDAGQEGFAVTVDVTEADNLTSSRIKSSTDVSQMSRPLVSEVTVESGQFRSADLFFPLDQSTLIGFLVHMQSRCISGELMLKTSEILLTIYTDAQGQLCLSDTSFALMEGIGERRSLGNQDKQNLQVRLKEIVIDGLTALCVKDDVQFRFVPKVDVPASSYTLPFTVYCCQILQNLLKGSRLDSFKSYYEARSTYFVNANDKAPIKASDFGLDRKPARFFDLVANEEHDLRMLLKVSPASNGETYRLLRMGELLELISFSSIRLTEVDLSQDHLTLLKQQFTRSQEGYFEAMGAHMVSHPKMYSTMLDDLKEKYSAQSEYGLHSFRHKELCAQIVRLAQEAFEYLSQRRLRVAYRKQRFDKAVLMQAADVLLEKADMNRLRGDQLRMRESLEMALELDPILTRQHVQDQKAEVSTKPDDVS